MSTYFQIEQFRALKNEEGHALKHNFRPIQPIGDRIVLYNIEESEVDESINENELPEEVSITDIKKDKDRYDIVPDEKTKEVDLTEDVPMEIPDQKLDDKKVTKRKHRKEKENSSSIAKPIGVLIGALAIFCHLLKNKNIFL